MTTPQSPRDSTLAHPPHEMTEVGPWRLIELRNWGAYGVVYRAEPRGLPGAGSFALKFALHPMDPRFFREAELLRRVLHPHVPRLHDHGQWTHPAGPFPYLVMDWVEGLSLYAWARGRTLTSRQVLRVLAPLARALAATHGVDAVHRDVKGENVLVRPEDSYPMLLDFGAGDFRGAPTLTREVLPPGTPAYRSPEALRFHWRFWQQPGARYEPGPADDVYSLGVTAYRLVTSTYPPPWVPPEILEREPSFPSPSSVSPADLVTVCPRLTEIIRQMLSEEPSARGSATQVAEALERAAETAGPEADQPITRRPMVAPAVRKSQPGSSRSARAWQPWVAAAAGVAAALTIQGGWDPRQHPPQDEPTQSEPEEGGENARTSLAKETLVVRAQVEQPEPTREVLSVELPKKPLPGQAQPPCKRSEVEIHGGCWRRLDNLKPPCRERDFEWREGCYYPIIVPTPPTTSEPR